MLLGVERAVAGGFTIATASADRRLVTGQRSWAPVGLWAISALSFLYVAFLYMVASNPAVRALGFGTIADVQQMSALFFVFLFFAALLVEHYAPEPSARASSGSAPSGGRAGSGGRAQGATVSLKDPHARPGSPPPMSIPRVYPDALEGGWQRWKFPSERTGGIYIDTDVVVDDIGPDGAGEPARGLYILRLRDEVARVCVRCDLMDHCHSKVKTLISKRDMVENSECVPGLRKIAKLKIERQNAARAAAEAAKAAALAPTADPSAQTAEEAPAATADAPPEAPAEPVPETAFESPPESSPETPPEKEE